MFWVQPEPESPSDEQLQSEADVILQMRARFRERLEVGLPLSLDEYIALGDDELGVRFREMYREVYVDFRAKEMAELARYMADAFTGGELCDATVWDELTEDQQDRLMLDRMKFMSRL